MLDILAIVIPAFKKTFLEEALESLVNQTNQKFKVYIGDDCSPHNLNEIIERYEDRLDIEYQYFDVNFGGNSLVKQWERCINMVGSEEWIWLFSDDDIIPDRCVENFYSILSEDASFDIYHFNVDVINEYGKVIQRGKEFPNILSVESFFKLKTQGKIKSYVVEYIFRKDAFNKVNGFEHFDLAWGTDDAMWIKLGVKSGIKTISGDRVLWRRSQENISPDRNPAISLRKFNAVIDFFNWFSLFALSNDIKVSRFSQLLGLFTTLRVPSYSLSWKQVNVDVLRIEAASISKGIIRVYLYFYRIIKFLTK